MMVQLIGRYPDEPTRIWLFENASAQMTVRFTLQAQGILSNAGPQVGSGILKGKLLAKKIVQLGALFLIPGSL